MGRLDEATRNTERILKFEPTYSIIASGEPPSEMKDIVRQQSKDQKIRIDGMRERRVGSLTVKCPSI